MMKTRIIMVCAAFILIMSGSLAYAQEYNSISGIVTTFRKYPVNKVTVLSTRTGESVLSDDNGMFTLKSQKGDILVLTAAGFEKKEIRVKGKKMLKAELIYVDNQNNFEKATSGGHISDELLRRALDESQNAAKRDFSKYKTIYELIASEISEVRVKGNTIISTKRRSFDTTPEVLLVVNERIVNDISYVDPGWVQSIELVDDVRTTLYGSKGANGVLKIVLK